MAKFLTFSKIHGCDKDREEGEEVEDRGRNANMNHTPHTSQASHLIKFDHLTESFSTKKRSQTDIIQTLFLR